MPASEARPSATRILIVGDDASVTERLSRLLRLEGHQVWTALSPDVGAALTRTHQPHAVILDLRMPLAGSIRAVRSIREAGENVDAAVAIVTGDDHAASDDLDQLKGLNAELRYKPFWLRELVQLARELVEVPAGA